MTISKQFNSLEELRRGDAISEGDIVHTYGYYSVGDGGGSVYKIVCENKGTYTDDGGSVIEITGKAPTDPAKAYYGVMLYTGEPVNVLQFGAKNKKEVYSNTLAGFRDDGIAIQKAIDFVKSRIVSLSEMELTTESTVFKVPDGTYYLKSQISFPPYLQMYIEGNVQFITHVEEGNTKLYRLEDDKFREYTGSELLNYEGEFFAKRLSKTVGNKKVYYIEEKTASGGSGTSGGSESGGMMSSSAETGDFFVYRKGAVKICYDYDEDGAQVINPFSGKTSVPPFAKATCIGGPGNLSIVNTIKQGYDDGTMDVPSICCGLEIGDFRDTLNVSKKARYDNINISNLKLCYFSVGLLCHPFNFYSDFFTNLEFFGNIVGYCLGTYSLNDPMYTGEDGASATIVGEPAYETGELIHISDSLFTGNVVDCRFIVSGSTHIFKNCHFDFSNCIFHAPVRTNIFVNGCHIEAVECKIKDCNFTGKINSAALQSYYNDSFAEQYYPWYGILYARPIRNFRGGIQERDYVHLSITDSDICDYYYLPLPLFVFEDESVSGSLLGHPNSLITLKNNSFHVGGYSSISYLTDKRKNTVYSGFMLPDRILENAVSGSNVAIEAEGNREWVGFPTVDYVHNYRFLSYRTLANKNPLFQNVSYSAENGWSGLSVDKTHFASSVEPKQESWARLADFDSAARGLCFTADTYTDAAAYEAAQNSYFELQLNDRVLCRKGEMFRAACVCSEIPYNKATVVNGNGVTVNKYESLRYRLTVTEYDKNGNALGDGYNYDLPFNVKITKDKNGGDVAPFAQMACSAAAKHCVRHDEAEKLGFKLKVVVPKMLKADGVGNELSVCGFFVENDKTSWWPCIKK